MVETRRLTSIFNQHSLPHHTNNRQVDGRVGVVGSGQGMTDFEKRNHFTKRNVMR